MTFIRHPNGRGRRYDEAEADAQTYLSKTTHLTGETHTFGARIENTESDTVADSLIYGAHLINTSVITTTIAGPVRAENSFLCCKAIAGNVQIDNSIIRGESVLQESAQIRNSAFRNLTIGGNAEVTDWIFHFEDWATEDGPYIFDGLFGRIMSGVWTKPPRIVRFDDLEITVTESTDGKAWVGCIEKPMQRWIDHGHELGKVGGWTPEQVDRLAEIFRTWLNSV